MAITLEDWIPMSPTMGPPLPRFLEIYWPWYEIEEPPEEPPPEEPPEKPTFVLNLTTTAGGTTIPAPGTYNYDKGVYLGVGAYPDEGYRFIEWQEAGVRVSTNPTMDVVFDRDRDLTAVFEKEPSVPFTYSDQRLWYYPIETTVWSWVDYRVTITNQTAYAGKRVITLIYERWDTYYGKLENRIVKTLSLELQPGESYTWLVSHIDSVGRQIRCEAHVEDDLGGGTQKAVFNK